MITFKDLIVEYFIDSAVAYLILGDGDIIGVTNDHLTTVFNKLY